MNIRTSITVLPILSLTILSACSVTVGMTDGTTESFQNTTESASDFSEASTESTSSTSPRFDDDSSSAAPAEEAQIRMRKAYTFVKPHYQNLKIDASRASGEYLQAVAESFEIPSERRLAFYQNTQKDFNRLFVQNKDLVKLIKDLYRIAYNS